MQPQPGSHEVDLALVRTALGGDRAAVDRLTERLACIPRILRHRAHLLCGGLPEPDLQDLAQSVFARIFERLGTYEGRASIESWAYAFCEGELRNALRRRTRRSTDIRIDADSAAAPPAPVEDFSDLFHCLDRLSPAAHEIVRRRHYDDLSFETIAVQSAANLNTIKSRYYRALLQLQLCLERHGRGDRR